MAEGRVRRLLIPARPRGLAGPVVVRRLVPIRDSLGAALVGVLAGSAIAVTMALGAYSDVVGELYDLSV